MLSHYIFQNPIRIYYYYSWFKDKKAEVQRGYDAYPMFKEVTELGFESRQFDTRAHSLNHNT